MKNLNAIFVVLLLVIISQVFAGENAISPDSVRYRFKPIVVTGQRYAMPQKDVAASVSIITPMEIKQTNLTTAAEVVSYLTPGVFTTRRSTVGYGVAVLAGGSISIRGIGGKPNTQVLVLIDGRPDFQGIFGHPINDAYLMDNVDHIEVLRGPASAVYGTNALGGVINIITKKLPTTGFRTNFNVQYGSYNTQRYLLQHSGALGRFQYFAAMSYNASDGHRKGSQFEGKNYALKLGYQINQHFNIRFNGNVMPYTFHDPGPVQGQDYLMGYFDFGDITRSSLDLTLTNKFASTDGTIKIHGNFGKHKLSDGWDSDDQTNGIIIFQNVNLPSELKATIGLDMKRFGGTARSNGNKIGTFFNDEIATYLHLQKIMFRKLILAAGIRLEDNSHFGQEWVPKFGMVYHLQSQTSLRVSVAKGFRTPTIKDLYLFRPANLNLKPERLWNYELGINQSLGRFLSLDVTAFHYRGDQLIQTAMVAPGQVLNQNIGVNNAKGFEVALKLIPTTKLTANLSYSYLKSDEILPFSPNKFNFMVNYRIRRWNVTMFGEHISNLYASYQLNQMPPTTQIEKLSDYTLVHLKLQYKLYRELQLSLGVENLFNESYEILKGYPMPGRTIFTYLSFSF